MSGTGKGFFSQHPDGDGVSVCGLVACRHCEQVKVKSSGWDDGGPWPRPVRILLLPGSRMCVGIRLQQGVDVISVKKSESRAVR